MPFQKMYFSYSVNLYFKINNPPSKEIKKSQTMTSGTLHRIQVKLSQSIKSHFPGWY